jgi:hypothetical protein
MKSVNVYSQAQVPNSERESAWGTVRNDIPVLINCQATLLVRSLSASTLNGCA